MAKARFPMDTISISSYFGDRTYTLNGKKVSDYHYGWDICGKDSKGGDLIYLPHNGYCVYTGFDKNGGNMIVTQHWGVDGVPKGKKLMCYYGHLYSISTYMNDHAKKQTPLKQGLIIGKEGCTGHLCTGNHLHFGCFIVPENYRFTTVTAMRKYAVNPGSICWAYPDQVVKSDPKKQIKKVEACVYEPN